MAENVSPEKIYIFEYELQREDHVVRYGVNQDKDIEGLIEYARTDAFIEKACAWFRTLDDKEPPYTTTEEFIEGFKKAMKL
jgi:hypothetical protein